MSRRSRRMPPGTSPGVLGVDPEALPSSVRVVAFGPKKHTEVEGCSLKVINELIASFPVTWIEVTGLGDLDLVERLGEHFQLHRLAIEDATNLPNRAKVESYENYDFIIAHAFAAGDTGNEQLAMFVGDRYVLMFREGSEDRFALVRQRAKDPAGRMRRRGPGYLAYALLDAAIDSFFPEVERVGDQLDTMEDELLAGGDERDLLSKLHEVRHRVQMLRRSIWPHRDVLTALQRGRATRFGAEVVPYLRDVQDHVVQITEMLDTWRERIASLRELHLSIANQRLNEVMKTLTVIATIFIPLTFLTGIYGMNFTWMPELTVWWGYPAILLVMLVVAVAMVIWFRRRRLL